MDFLTFIYPVVFCKALIKIIFALRFAIMATETMFTLHKKRNIKMNTPNSPKIKAIGNP